MDDIIFKYYIITSLGIVSHNYYLRKGDERIFRSRSSTRTDAGILASQGLQPEGLLPFAKTVNMFKILPILVSLTYIITNICRRD